MQVSKGGLCDHSRRLAETQSIFTPSNRMFFGPPFVGTFRFPKNWSRHWLYRHDRNTSNVPNPDPEASPAHGEVHSGPKPKTSSWDCRKARAVGDTEWLSQALPTRLHSQTCSRSPLYSQQGTCCSLWETARNLWESPINAKNRQQGLSPAAEGALGGARLPLPLLAPLTFQAKLTVCFPALLNP